MAKSRRKKKIALAWVVGIFSALGLTYIFLDDITESTIKDIAQKNDIEISSLHLEHLNTEWISAEKIALDWMAFDLLNVGVKVGKVMKPQWWKYFIPNNLLRATVEDLKIESDAGQVDIKKLQFVYFWKKLNLFLNATSIDGLSIRVDLPKLYKLMGETSGNGTDDNQTKPSGLAIAEYLKYPPLAHMRLRDSTIEVSGQDGVLGLEFNSTSLFTEGFLNFQIDASLLGMPMKSDLTFSLEDDILHMTSKLQALDLENADFSSEQMKNLGILTSPSFSIQGGDLVFRKNATLDINDSNINQQILESLFVEVNASDLEFNVGNEKLQISKFMAFVTDFSQGVPSTINAYANLTWNNQIEAVGARMQKRRLGSDGTRADKDAISAEIWELNGSKQFPVKVRNLSIPFFEVDVNSSFEEMFTETREVRFDHLSWDSGTVNLEEGRILFKGHENLKLWDLEMPPLTFHMPGSQLTFTDFSYRGTVDFSLLPEVPDFQEIRIPKVQVGDDFMMNDIFLEFRVLSARQLELKTLKFSMGDIIFKMDPANIIIQTEQDPLADANYSISFNRSHFVLSNKEYEVELVDLDGSVKIKSLNPFTTANEQLLSFNQVNVGDFEFIDGNLSVSVEKGEVCQIHHLSMSGFDGRLGLGESIISLNQKESRIVLDFDQVCGQRLVDLFKDLDLQIDGNFSGQIPIAPDSANVWDFIGGFLKFVDEGKGYYSWNAKGLLSNTLDESDLLYKQTVLAEAALQNLSMDAMRLDFKVVDGTREIRGLIQGTAEVEGKKIDLDYKPKITGDLKEIIEAIDLIKFQVNR
ncbi:MAG: YdbH domain-containing protein [Opitutales bacterium]|nr:YdbH domain-containing protein [Opitutales bacterium]